MTAGATDFSSADLDRLLFGAYLSGFVDGEGCFMLNIGSRNGYRWGRALFVIKLRADDLPILCRIKEFLKCGTINVAKRGYGNDKPQAAFKVGSLADLVNVIVPLFERHPLRAKKAADFAVWKRGVRLAHQTRLKPQHHTGTTGRCVTWTDVELAEFSSLCAELESVRGYEAYRPTGGLPDPLPFQRVERFVKKFTLPPELVTAYRDGHIVSMDVARVVGCSQPYATKLLAAASIDTSAHRACRPMNRAVLSAEMLARYQSGEWCITDVAGAVKRTRAVARKLLLRAGAILRPRHLARATGLVARLPLKDA